MSPDTPRLRLSILGIVVVSLFAALFARLWYLQIMVAPEFQAEAEQNRVRIVAVQAPRGRILDRDGTVLVDNRISVVVTIDRVALRELEDRDRDDVLERLAARLTAAGQPTTVEQIEERLEDQRFSPYTPVPVAQDVPESLKIYLEERADEFPSVAVERSSVRRYPYGPIAAHVLGYVGEINDTELEAVADEEDKPYELGDDIGKAGVERTYESVLRGVPGIRRIEVDAEGDPVRVIDEDPAVPGDDIVLTIDVDVQALAEQTLARGLEQARQRGVRTGEPKNIAPVGSVVVQDPLNGQVLAMASYPSYDPSQFVNGISTALWDRLTGERPDNHFPLNNRALQGQYAPGSTFKLFSGYAALMRGIRAPNTTINDPGFYDIPGCDPQSGGCTKYNDRRTKHGLVDMRRALTVSSDVFFYEIGAQFWINQDTLGGPTAFQAQLEQFGFDVDTGIALPGEQAGRIPDPEWRKEFCKNVECIDERWFTGDNVNMAIGQGDVLVTPLQLANAYGAFANGGILRTPLIVKEVREYGDSRVVRTEKAKVIREVEIPAAYHEVLQGGLLGVPQSGTAAGAFGGFPHESFALAAKTGTAQVTGKAPTSLFVAYGPVPAPRFVVSVVLEEAGYGSTAAAPIARTLFDVFAGVEPLPKAPTGGTYDPEVAAQIEPEPVTNTEVRD